jgi:hypothetical protein
MHYPPVSSAAGDDFVTLGNAGWVMQRPPTGRWPVQSPGEGQLAVNALQVLEVLADDSNFRRMAMQSVAGPAASMLSLPQPEFEAAWCAGAFPISTSFPSARSAESEIPS